MSPCSPTNHYNANYYLMIRLKKICTPFACTVVHPFVNSAALLKYFLKLMLFVAYLTNVAFQSNVIFLVAELTGCDDSAVKMTKLS